VPAIPEGEPCDERPDACMPLYFCDLPRSTCQTLPIFESCDEDGECGGELKTYCR
jgi:hypothetical protein